MTGTQRPLIAGNWKMNGLRRDGLALAEALAMRVREQSPRAEVAVCPPATLLGDVAKVLEGTGVALGAQDSSPYESGAHTGDISPVMLADVGCRYVILGHSERRADHGETDADVKAKVSAALNAGLRSIVCVGESGAERDAGQALNIVGDMLAGSLPPDLSADDLVIAYEPVWAIGTGRTPTIDDIAEMHGTIRRRLGEMGSGLADGVRILYGGSVKADNAASILAAQDVDGALVGGASLDADSFWTICNAVPANR